MTSVAATGPAEALKPTPFEIACGFVTGECPDAPWMEHTGETPRAAFEACILEVLQRPPCFVTFSGGRDSSVVLAIAVQLARREGLDPPVPVTHVFPGRPETDERAWARQVIDHLGVRDWQVVELRDELDLIGPVARPILRRHGVLFPFNCHFHGPAVDLAAGGSLLTGSGGDELFSLWPFGALIAPLRGARRPVMGDLRRLGLWTLPRLLRRRLAARFGQTGETWLRPEARARAHRAWAQEYAEEPRLWRARTRWLARRRDVALSKHGTELMAADAGVAISDPLLEPRFVAAVAHGFGPLGPRDRTTAMKRLFGDLLPAPVLERRSKTGYLAAYVTETTREFARGFEGDGLDHALVDLDALRRTWAHDRGLLASGGLIQWLWLRSDGCGGE